MATFGNSNWGRIPFALILTIFWVVLKTFGANTSHHGFLGITLILLMFAVLVFEFFKIADTRTLSHLIDLTFSWLTTAVMCASVAVMVTKNGWGSMNIVDLLLACSLPIDGVLNPWMAYCMRRTNTQVEIGS